MCDKLPCQKQNIKPHNIYDNIEIDCSKWIHMACEEALYSVKNGGGPYGAVILRIDKETRKIIEYWKSHNYVKLWSDPTAHAEICTIRFACNDLSKRYDKPILDLGNIIDPITNKESFCILFSSCESCGMCQAAMLWAKIPILVFAATAYDADQHGVGLDELFIMKELELPYNKREKMKVYQASCGNSLDAFNFWKRQIRVKWQAPRIK